MTSGPQGNQHGLSETQGEVEAGRGEKQQALIECCVVPGRALPSQKPSGCPPGGARAPGCGPGCIICQKGPPWAAAGPQVGLKGQAETQGDIGAGRGENE